MAIRVYVTNPIRGTTFIDIWQISIPCIKLHSFSFDIGRLIWACEYELVKQRQI